MKRIAKIVASPMTVVAFVALMAGGCAGVQQETAKPENQRKLSAAEYVSAIETQAVRRGFHVQWVNPPRKR